MIVYVMLYGLFCFCFYIAVCLCVFVNMWSRELFVVDCVVVCLFVCCMFMGVCMLFKRVCVVCFC